MGERSAIEWTSATWNPWRGCDKVSPGCAHCYMFTDQRRYGRDPSVVVRCSDATFYAPLRKRAWRELPPGSHVFTCSWSDWFHETADPWRAEAWDVIRQRPDLTWQILTKRPDRILEHLPPDWGNGWPHVWMGVTIENRRYVDRADMLRAVPAAVRFISAEPLLGPLVIPAGGNDVLADWCCRRCDGSMSAPVFARDALSERERRQLGKMPEDVVGGRACDACDARGTMPELDLSGIDWLIAGGESGPRCRPMRLEWARDLREVCETADVLFFLKQLGGNPHKRGGEQAHLDGRRHVEMPLRELAQRTGSA